MTTSPLARPLDRSETRAPSASDTPFTKCLRGCRVTFAPSIRPLCDIWGAPFCAEVTRQIRAELFLKVHLLTLPPPGKTQNGYSPAGFRPMADVLRDDSVVESW